MKQLNNKNRLFQCPSVFVYQKIINSWKKASLWIQLNKFYFNNYVQKFVYINV